MSWVAVYASGIAIGLVLMIWRDIGWAMMAAIPALIGSSMLQFIVFFRLRGPADDRGRARRLKLTLFGGSDKDGWVEAARMLGWDPHKWLAIRRGLFATFVIVGIVMVLVVNGD